MKPSKKEMVALAKRLGSRYKSKWFASYSKTKVKTDPAYEAIFEQLSETEGPVLDIGCGVGLLGFYLHERGLDRFMMGIDYDAKKIRAAQEIAERDCEGKLKFGGADAREGIPEFSGNVTILDILQYFEHDQQRELLQSAAARVAPGGKLLVNPSGGLTFGGHFVGGSNMFSCWSARREMIARELPRGLVHGTGSTVAQYGVAMTLERGE